ncbi:NACHT domain-containing protein [Falsiroseomonas oryzae]|uniref:NACHT domain-containing protein n=1 Tax=Falsiroseomonas oryzae TaxID=2766473 RepID=UPI0022EB5930|nr:NACHT domain-containing protein [Roseomonas sp. MO-31]
MGELVGQAAAAAAQPIIRKALERATTQLIAYVEKTTKKAVDRSAISLRLGVDDYLLSSYLQCRYFKSLLNPQHPQDVTTQYVNIDLSLGPQNARMSDIDFGKHLFERKSIVVTGLAGSGKSMLLRHITVNAIAEDRGAIPLFVELRQLNSITNKDLLTFVRTNCTRPDEAISEDRFKLALESNVFFLILDGFDEINFDIRDEVQKQIFDLRRRFPNLTIVVSSRPDQRFGAWTEFFVYSVCDLTKEQTTELVRGLDYDSGVKKRFLANVVDIQYETHRGFLASPLLTTIMLLTYEEFADLPSKMHAFYSQAFDTMLQKHDAQKRQFRRKTRTGLSRDDFRACFAAFCTFSYSREKYLFTEDNAIEVADTAIKYMRTISKESFVRVNASDFVLDLRESVCMLQQDGLYIGFVHRSFQEYFTAVFLTSIGSQQIRKAMDKFILRFTDNVISMSHDMARDLVEREWVLPNLVELIEALDRERDEQTPAACQTKALMPDMLLGAYGPNRSLILTPVINPRQPRLYFVITLLNIYRTEFGGLFDLFSSNVENTLRLSVNKKMNANKHRQRQLKRFLKDFAYREAKDEQVELRQASSLSVQVTELDEWWLSEVGMLDFFRNLRLKLTNLRADIARRVEEKIDIVGSFI